MKSAGIAITIAALTWWSLWWTPDQYGQRLMDQGQYKEAAEIFEDPVHQGVAWYRAGEFEKAEQSFARVATAEAEYNRGNCLVMLGKYDPAVERFDRALELQPAFEDAKVNREIAATRARQLERTGGDMGDQKIGADEIRYDRNKKPGGQDTEVDGAQPVADAAMQALWLRRLQTSPGDFLRAKFAYQLSTASEAGDTPDNGGPK